MFSALGEIFSQKLEVINKYHNNQAIEISVKDPDPEISCLRSMNVHRRGLRRQL